jgi:small-conductance mechanosensitive channel
VVRIDEIRDSDFQFKLIVWVHDPIATVRVASDLRFAIAQAFAARGVRFPTPELELQTPPVQADPSTLAEAPPETPH